ncbi:hypothetical protein L873DRAFT_1650277, partial [Choiromyces venosus 120613-1]
SSRTTFSCPPSAAKCSAIFPSLPCRAFTSAPRSRTIFASGSWPFADAHCSAVRP